MFYNKTNQLVDCKVEYFKTNQTYVAFVITMIDQYEQNSTGECLFFSEEDMVKIL